MPGLKDIRGRQIRLRPRRYVNVSGLLASGHFYIDDNGYLVSPNGTRYRLPSGPPEGRTSTNLQPVFPGSSQHFQLADSAAVLEQPMIDTLSSYNLSSTEVLQLHPVNFLREPVFDWPIIMFTLIAGSVALVSNMLLVIISSYYLCRRPRKKNRIPMTNSVISNEVRPISGSIRYYRSLRDPVKSTKRTNDYRSAPCSEDESNSKFMTKVCDLLKI